MFIHSHRQVIIYALIFLVNLLLVSPSLMPDFATVNPDDEAKYVDSGWRLLRGDVRDLAWGPLVAVVYAPIHLAASGSPDWFMLEVWIGGFILYTFLWWAIFYLALQLKEYLSPYIMLGVLFVSTPFFPLLKFQSDLVFTGLSTLALAQLIHYFRHKNLKNLGIASLLTGLGILARVESAVLLGILAVSGLFIGWTRGPKFKILLTAIAPALCILGVFLLSSLFLVGNINLGTDSKSYDSFEFDQVVVTGGDIEQAKLETRRLFGTKEENQGSMLRAILRNPVAYGMRILANAKTVPDFYFFFFGKRLGAVLLIFAIWGGYILIRKKSITLLLLLLFWALHATVHLGFLAIHIVPQIVYLPLLFGAVGITGAFSLDLRSGERVFFLLFNLLIFIVTWMTNKPAFLFGFLLVVFVLILSWLTQPGAKTELQLRQVPVFCLLASGLILRGAYPFPNYPTLGKTFEEQAVHYLEKNLPFQATVLVPTPLQALAAKLAYVKYSEIPLTVTSIQEFWSWLKQNNVFAIYLDSNRRVRNDIYDLMETGYEDYFNLEYTTEDNIIRVFWVK